jgi:hypothetical protein
MNANPLKQYRWIEFIALALAFIGVMIAVVSSYIIISNQVQVFKTQIWPLPGLVLTDWILLGLLGFLAPLLGLLSPSSSWAKINVNWFVSGSFLPLAVLGAFSIGPFVLISLLFVLVSAVIMTVLWKMKWLLNLGLLLLGAAANLVLLLIFITLGNLSF